MITNEPEIISGYKRAILTPNAIEFSRLYEKMVLNAALKFSLAWFFVNSLEKSSSLAVIALTQKLSSLQLKWATSQCWGRARLIPSVIETKANIILLWYYYYIPWLIFIIFTVIRCEEVGYPRRCGGQRDLLSGIIIGLFAVWARQAEKKLVAHWLWTLHHIIMNFSLSTSHQLPPLMVASFGGCYWWRNVLKLHSGSIAYIIYCVVRCNDTNKQTYEVVDPWLNSFCPSAINWLLGVVLLIIFSSITRQIVVLLWVCKRLCCVGFTRLHCWAYQSHGTPIPRKVPLDPKVLFPAAIIGDTMCCVLQISSPEVVSVPWVQYILEAKLSSLAACWGHTDYLTVATRVRGWPWLHQVRGWLSRCLVRYWLKCGLPTGARVPSAVTIID